jgi:hypothetical protein
MVQMSGPADFNRLGDLLDEEYGLPPVAARDEASQDPARLLAAIWANVVGDEVAANARPVQLRKGRLVVSASSSAWAQTLQLMSEPIAAGLCKHLGDGVVTSVVFRHAGWEEREIGSSPARRRVGGQRDSRDRRTTSSELPQGGAMGVRTAGHLASAERPDHGGAGGAKTLTDEQRAALAEVDMLGLSPALRDQIARAMEAAFVRAQQDSVR